MASQVEYDIYCWRCHTDKTTLKCSSCPRSFHMDCLKEDQRNIGNEETWRCVVCVKLDSNKDSDDRVKDTLPIIIGWAFKQKKYASLKRFIRGFYLMNLKTINDKIGTYTSFDEVITDAGWIIHNTSIASPGNYELIDVAYALSDYLKEEFKVVKMCADCYLNENKRSNGDSTALCTKVHIVVWAKASGWDYWPAKLIRGDEQTVHVRFFDSEYEMAQIPNEKCFLYSKVSPSRGITRAPAKLEEALKQADKYIKNVADRYGSYHLAETLIPFNPTMLNQYLLDTIPGAVNSVASGLEGDIHSDVDLSTLPIVYEPSGLFCDFAKCDPSALGDNIDRESGSNDQINTEQAEFLIDTAGDVTQQNIGNDASVEVPGHTAQSGESTSDSWNLVKCQEVMNDITLKTITVSGFLYDLNVKLQEEKENLIAEHNRRIKVLETKIALLEAEKDKCNKLLETKDEEKRKAINQTKKRCHEEYARCLENNKRMKFCKSCDSAKPQDTFYFCNDKCARNWTGMDK